MLIFPNYAFVITYFSEFNQIFGQEDITSPLYSSSKSVEWKNKHLIEL